MWTIHLHRLKNLATWSTVLLLLVPSASLEANTSSGTETGNVATAAPVDGIAIDGNLSDWPAEMTRYPIFWTRCKSD